VNSKASFDRKSNPVLSVVKTVDKATPAIGETVTYTITIKYPKVADVVSACGDDSIAKTIVVTDAIPTQVTYTAGTLKLTTNGGAPVALSDAADADAGEVVGADVTVRPSDMNEGDGDAACTAANTRVIEFKGVVNSN
jgi:fimbrial isopeptide formation D2 family protein